MADSKKVRMEEAIITDDIITEMRSKVGLRLRIEDSIFNEEATRMAILKFADGIGDPNPLWRDAEYAQRTAYGKIIAPPSWVFSVFPGQQFGWRGLAGFHSATDMEFYKHISLGDKITAECVYIGFEESTQSKFAERIIKDRFEVKYYNQKNELVAKVKRMVIRTERGKAKQVGKYSNITLPYPWTEDELSRIEEEVLSEEIRGSNTRYWEDVDIDDELKPVVKGPLGVSDIIAFNVGGGAPIPRIAAHGIQLRKYRKHPAWAFRDPETYALEPIYAVHYNKRAANAMGLPFPYDVGNQRHCWQIHLLTNWMGDDGWLRRSYAEYRRFVYHSDVVWLKGKVKKKYVDENGKYCVDIETQAINQRKEQVMPGYATVVLLSKQQRNSPVIDLRKME